VGSFQASIGTFVGDSGSGGQVGLVPAPATGDAAAGKFLKADGTWTAPSAVASAVYAPITIRRLTSGTTYNKNYSFVITSGSATVGATYTNNAVTFTVYATVASATLVVMSGSGPPASSGTLTKSAGTGDATLTFTQVLAPIYLIVELVGGGGGGGGAATASSASGCAGGGGGGGYVKHLYTSPVAATFAYTIGSAGAVGAAGNNNGGTGGDTTFGALTASAGTGGIGSGAAASPLAKGGGDGGAASGGNIANIIGGQGSPGIICSGAEGTAGNGGSTPFSMPTKGYVGASHAGVDATANTGGGGSGAIQVNNGGNVAGGLGGTGLVIVHEHYQ
jgi:hypothetical protein